MKKPKNVALITPSWPTGSLANGIVTYIEQMYGGFKAIGLECAVLTWRGGDETNLDIYPIIEKKSSALLKISNKVRGLLELGQGSQGESGTRIAETLKGIPVDKQPFIIEQAENFGASYRTQQCTNIPVITRLHGPYFLHGDIDNHPKDKAYLNRLENEKKAILYTAGVSSPSRDVLQKTIDFYNVELEGAAVIPNPIAIPEERETWHYEACDPNRLLFVGRFDNRKGGDLVVDAFAKLLQQFPHAMLDFVGPDIGYEDEDGKRWLIKDYIEEKYPQMLGQEKIKIHGKLPAEKIKKFRQQAFVTLIASRYDNFPYTVMEALSYGSPIVAANVGGIPEIVNDGISGVLFNGGDADSLLQSIANLLKNHSFAIKLGENARREAIAKYSITTVASQMSDFYQERLARYRLEQQT
ncbi:MAG: Spore coat protein [Cyanobacteriota bacterium]